MYLSDWEYFNPIRRHGDYEVRWGVIDRAFKSYNLFIKLTLTVALLTANGVFCF